jgi:hypothetical protein
MTLAAARAGDQLAGEVARAVAGAVMLWLAAVTCAAELRAQDTLPPHLGGYVRSLGLPPIHHPYAALALGLDRGARSRPGVQVRLGLADPIGSPVASPLSLGAELYGGVRDARATGGVRALAMFPIIGSGIGVDRDLRAGRTDLFLTVVANVRRGGVLGRGTHLRLDWYPTRAGSLSTAFVAPLAAGHQGRTRPLLDHVVLRAVPPRRIDFTPSPALAESLGRIADGAHWINRLSIVPLGGASANPHKAAAGVLPPLQERLARRSVAEEVGAYHDELDRAFSIVLSQYGDTLVSELGRRLAAQARSTLLHGVLHPYNRLLGQSKREDTTLEFAVHARGRFAQWLVHGRVVAPEYLESVLFVFQHMLDVVEATRAWNRAGAVDERLVWLPLQLALRPEEYVLKEALDTIISDAVGRRILHGNRMWYIYNSRFHQQLVRSIADAEDYHVLWVHDFRGLNADSKPDSLSLNVVTREYFAALTRRVAAYDSTARIPAYMLLLDQHYFELNSSRALLELLQNPLAPLRLPKLPRELADTIVAWQTRLRNAVDGSRLLGIERTEYGERWLRRLVKVHVSVTNPADPSFRSRHGISFMTVPDDIMRDHRKAIVYDVSEADPFRGMAMYAGMGVGEHYATAAWEDRALMLQGPAALSLRDAARTLLEGHGLRDSEIPHVLRPRRRAPDYDARIEEEIIRLDDIGEVAVRAVELHNSTGFGPKEIAVAQAALFNLTSPGAVFKIPDSLWMNELLASLLGGAALRGTRVLPIAPSATSAPAPALGLAGIHDVFSRLIAFGHTMAPEIARAGGLLRPGVYHTTAAVHDLDARIAALAVTLDKNAFLRELFPTLAPVVAELAGSASEPAGEPTLLPMSAAAAQTAPPTAAPAKLHMKGFLYVSQPAWSYLMEGPLLTSALLVYLQERELLRQGETDEQSMVHALQRVGAELINPVRDALTPEERSAWVFYLQIGSPNLDYRRMLLDGEVAALVSDWTSLYAFFDFMLLLGLVEWVEDQQRFDALVPRPGPLKRRLARWIRFAL